MSKQGRNGVALRAQSVRYENAISHGPAIADATAKLATTAVTCQAPSRGGGRVCGSGLGESMVRLRLVGVFKRWDERRAVSGPRDVRRCKKCGWYNISEPMLDTQSDDR